ncbi:hypothetical protein Tco_0495458, partial [Tanacetum coccineum]
MTGDPTKVIVCACDNAHSRSDVGSEQYSANNPDFNTLRGTIHLNMASDVSIN